MWYGTKDYHTTGAYNVASGGSTEKGVMYEDDEGGVYP